MISIDNVSVTLAGRQILDNISLVIGSDQCWAVTGASGSGKTTFAKVLTGSVFHQGVVRYSGFNEDPVIQFVPQEHQFRNAQNTNDLYYQQRYNSTESDDSLKVGDLVNGDSDWVKLLHLDGLLGRPLLQLSNGENKRLQLAQKLASNPRILILDNPFLGLDADARRVLDEVLSHLVKNGLQVILITTSQSLPDWITHVALLDEGCLKFAGARGDLPSQAPNPKTFQGFEQLLSFAAPPTAEFDIAIRMHKVNIEYEQKHVLRDIDWIVKKGECWSLSGPNGAGKSTLLSLVTGDNPQAYANEIYLFDRRRGTGESIWDIKRNIGFVSPELHLYFNQSSSCSEVVASGLFDTIGLFRVLSDEQQILVDKWLEVLGLGNCRHRSLQAMSRGEQRLAMLGRALMKNPPMLILDEPTQGLDQQQVDFFKGLVDFVCNVFGTTLIYVSHYVEDIPGCVKYFIRLEDGRVV